MNVQNLRDNYPKLISYMETKCYSKTYVGRLKWEIKKILSTVDSNEWSCYLEVYQDYTKTLHSDNYLRDKRTIIGAIEQFYVHGRYPDGSRRHELFKRGAYPLLSPEFKSIIDIYCETEKKRGKKLTTIYTGFHNASTFFLSLQQNGIDNLAKITEEAVIFIFMAPDGTLLIENKNVQFLLRPRRLLHKLEIYAF